MGYRSDLYVVINKADKDSFLAATKEGPWYPDNSYSQWFSFERELSGDRLLFARYETKSSIWVSDEFEAWTDSHPCQLAWRGESEGDVGVITKGDIKSHFSIRKVESLEEDWDYVDE